MARMLVGIVIGFSLATVVGLSQGGDSSVDPFNGTWHLNVEETTRRWGSSPVHEIISFQIGDDGVQHYQVEIQSSEDAPLRKGWYDSKYNDDTFVPYNGTVYPADGGMEVMTVKVDERTHYRIARTREGEARYVMMRRLSDDGQAYMSAGLTIDGEPGLYRWMERAE